jgi:hypothetical protein
MKKLQRYFILFMLVSSLVAALTSCGYGDPPRTRNCDTYKILDKEIFTSFFNYDDIDTLRYVRFVDSIVVDTLVFAKKQRIRDSLRVAFTDINDCISEKIYYEHWEYLYQEINSPLTYKVELIGQGDAGFGVCTYLVTTKNKIIYGKLGTLSYGDIGYAGYLPEVATSQGNFYDAHEWCFIYSYGAMERNGYRGSLDDSGVTSIYNTRYGRLQIGFDHGKEIWDLMR